MNDQKTSEMSAKRSLIPTVLAGVGFLIGGLLGLGIGYVVGGEFAVMIGYSAGAIAGVVVAAGASRRAKA